MSYPPIVAGFAGVVAGVVIGLAIGGSMVGDRIDTAVARAMERAQEGAGGASAATGEAITALGDRIAELETSLADSAADTTQISEAVRAQLGEMQDALAARIDAVSDSAGEGTASLRAAFQEMHEGMRARMGQMMDSEGTAPASDAANVAAGADEAAKAGPSAEAAEMQAGVGQTAIFGDGAVRAFVSRIDAEGGAARISVNGDTVSLAVGEATTVSLDGSECSVFLTGIDGSLAALASDCGGAPAEAAADAPAADAPAAPENGYRPGQTVQLADGALRVFVSGIASDGARIAINGVETQVVAAGDSVEVAAGDQTCTVTVTGVGDGIVGLDGSCS